VPDVASPLGDVAWPYSYAGWIGDAERLAQPADEAARTMLFHGAAARFYGMGL
jgi:hypothetical protein